MDLGMKNMKLVAKISIKTLDIVPFVVVECLVVQCRDDRSWLDNTLDRLSELYAIDSSVFPPLRAVGDEVLAGGDGRGPDGGHGAAVVVQLAPTVPPVRLPEEPGGTRRGDAARHCICVLLYM